MFSLEQEYFWFVGKRLFIKQAMGSIPIKSRKILDIGAGTGGTTAFLSHFGRVTGIESKKSAQALARRLDIYLRAGSANKLTYKKTSFDIVTFFDVLYHKGIDEQKALSEAYRVLKPGGYIMITDCALPSLWSRHDIIMDAKYRYTKRHLTSLVEGAGFTVHRCQYIFSSIFPLFVASRFIGSSSTIKKLPTLANRMLIILLRLEASLPRWVPKTLGSSILILARKP